MKIKKNVKLARYTTFHIGGLAEFFAEINSIDELEEAINFAKEKRIKINILGGGSNILIPDRGLRGLVLKINIQGIKVAENTLYAGAGETWDRVVSRAVSKKLGGIENLSLIPGTVGGAVYQNIGAYGAELKDVLISADIFDLRTRKVKTLSKQDCRLDYRTSVFQKEPGKNYVIIGAKLELSKNPSFNLRYPDLANYFKDKIPNIYEIREAVIKIRRKKLIYPTKNIGTAGSFFKNPIITSADFQKLLSDYPELKGRDIGDGLVKLSAGQLIERSGWKGKLKGRAGVSKKHALVLISHKGAKADDIKNLARNIQNSIKKRFDINLEPEVKIVH